MSIPDISILYSEQTTMYSMRRSFLLLDNDCRISFFFLEFFCKAFPIPALRERFDLHAIQFSVRGFFFWLYIFFGSHPNNLANP